MTPMTPSTIPANNSVDARLFNERVETKVHRMLVDRGYNSIVRTADGFDSLDKDGHVVKLVLMDDNKLSIKALRAMMEVPDKSSSYSPRTVRRLSHAKRSM